MTPNPSIVDVLIIGAGISGISAACHLRQKCPDKRFLILEGRENIGGTWDLFRYPGIRSDSDMHTFGFEFKPWTKPRTLADGPSILEYLRQAVEEHGVAQHIRFGHRVVGADWQSEHSAWAVTAETPDGQAMEFRGRILFMCSGYYNYESGYTPQLPGLDRFRGTLVHPQHWPQGLDYRDKRVVVIGSGATAVTLVPAMAEDAAKVTMIQRSPTYIVSRPGEDRLAKVLNRLLPSRLAYRLTRWRNIRFQNLVYKRSRENPGKLRAQILHLARKQLGEGFDIDKHFTPRYNPWDQRLCLVPDADLFEALKRGKAEVVTGRIDAITETGVRMESGEEIPADILVTATGLRLQLLGGVEFFQDGVRLDFTRHFLYQGMMFSDVPNLVQTFGYINASWTLRADLNSRFVCDILRHMDETGTSVCMPRLRRTERDMPAHQWITDFSPGYMQRGMHQFPRQGDHVPWRNTQDYLLDRRMIRKGLIGDGVLQFQ